MAHPGKPGGLLHRGSKRSPVEIEELIYEVGRDLLHVFGQPFADLSLGLVPDVNSNDFLVQLIQLWIFIGRTIESHAHIVTWRLMVSKQKPVVLPL